MFLNIKTDNFLFQAVDFNDSLKINELLCSPKTNFVLRTIAVIKKVVLKIASQINVGRNLAPMIRFCLQAGGFSIINI